MKFNVYPALKVLTGTLLTLFIFLPLSCDDDDEDSNLEGTYYGEAVAVGQGTAKAWVSTSATGTPTSVGVTLSEAAVTSPGSAMRMYILPLPTQGSQTLYKHVMLDWNPQGHEPPGLYDVPHFDTHFYMMAASDVMNIIGQTNMDEEPETRFVPQNYVLTPGVVPGMGAHWVDVTDQNNSPGNFKRNFIYGSIDGNFIFHEPMFTQAFLTSLATIGTQTIAIPQSASYQKAGLYPMKYSFSFNSSTREYTIALLELTARQ